MDNRVVCINERKFLVWNDDIMQINKEMIENIDCSFYEKQCDYVNELIENDEKLDYNRKQIINIFGHIAETFFALLFASIQTPSFYYGWISNYKNYELYSLLKKTDENIYFPNKIELKEITWDKIAIKLSPIDYKDYGEKLGKYWKKMYKEYMNVLCIYNSIKHGLRIKHDGIRNLRIGEIEFDNEEFQNGFSVYQMENIDEDANNYSIYKTIYHFNLLKVKYYIELASFSIANMKSFLIKYNNLPEPEKFIYYGLTDEWEEEFNNLKEPKIKGVKKFIQGYEILKPLPDKIEINNFYNGK